MCDLQSLREQRQLQDFLGPSHGCRGCGNVFLAHGDGCPDCGPSAILKSLNKGPSITREKGIIIGRLIFDLKTREMTIVGIE